MSVVVLLPVLQCRPWWSQMIERVRYGPRSGAVVRVRIRQHIGRPERLQGDKR